MGTDKRARQKELHKSRLEEARRDAEKRARTQRVVRIGGLVGAVVIALVAIAFFTSDDSSSKKASAKSTTTAAAGPTTTKVAAPAAVCPPTDGSATRTTAFGTPFPDNCTDAKKTYVAKVDTSEGTFTIDLDPKKAPKTVNNFVSLARWKFYDGLTFHRIIKDFMNQGGDPEGTGSGGPGYQFADELPGANEYKAGSVAMANSGPNTNGSQFFVVASANGAKSLAASYSLFGQVGDGMDVITKMNNVATGQGDKPVTPVTIKSVTITES